MMSDFWCDDVRPCRYGRVWYLFWDFGIWRFWDWVGHV